MAEPTSQGFRLSLQQRRLCLAPGGAQAYRAQGALLIDGELSATALRKAVERVVERHEILRTRFRRPPGLRVPFQVDGQGGAAFDWLEVDLTGADEADRRRRLAELLSPDLWSPFNLENGPLLQAVLTALEPGRHLLALRMPALCADSRSLENLFDEVSRAYSAATVGSGPAVGEEEPVQYTSFSEWQYELLETDDEDLRLGRAHWARQDLAALASFTLPGMRDAAPGESFVPSSVPVELELSRVQRLEALAESRQTSLQVLLLAAWQILLGRLGAQTDPVVGVVFDGRKYEELEGCLGPFARVLPVQGHLGTAPRLRDFVARTAEACRLAHEWQEYGLAGEDAGPEFPALFEFESRRRHWVVDGVSFSSFAKAVFFERFKVKLHGTRLDGDLVLEVQHDPEVLPAVEARLLARRLGTLLDEIGRRPEARIDDLELLSEVERHRLAVELNDSAVCFAEGETVHLRFRRQAALTPASPAVVYDDRRLTYAELDRASDCVARRLRELGVGAGDRVALLLERSPELVAALLGALKAGAAYVPLDLALPRPRLAMMLEDVAAAALVSHSSLDPGELRPEARLVRLDRLRDLGGEGDGAVPAEPAPEVAGDLAYVLFTSGSTGRPKGVAVGHRQLLNYVDGFLERTGLAPGASFATVSTFAADLGNTMVFPALLTGGCLHVVAHERSTDADSFASYMRKHAVECLKIVPSHLAALLAAASPQDVLPRRLLVLGGEASTWRLIERIESLAPACRIFNHYGPTETTVGVTTLEVKPGGPRPPSATVPLGRPLANSRILLLDGGLHLAAPGVPAELYVGGAGLARGYFGRPDLTAERFVPDPVGEPGFRLYRTGDLARLLPLSGEDTFEFLGRLDHQVKIHGFRIETREIELALARRPTVRDALVTVRQDTPEERRLVAYVVPRPGHELSPEALRSALREELPAYMLPSAIVTLAALPLTPNGKVDLRALPAPERAEGRAGAAYAAPRNPVEETLARIWSHVLGVPRVGIHDNFFELRGDSILAIQVIAAANREGLALQPRHLFEHQTIARLSSVVGSGPRIHAEQGPVTGPVPLTPIQHWFFERRLANPHHWNMSALWAVEDALPPAAVSAVVRRLLEHHDAFRLRFTPDAPESAGWRQHGVGVEDLDGHLSVVDLVAVPEPDQARAVEAAVGALQSTLDLTRGPLLWIALLRLGPGRPGRLLICVHHLVMDGISWRVLLEDLQTAWEQLAAGRPFDLPPKTTSFRHWAERLVAYAGSAAAEEELGYWLAAFPAAWLTEAPAEAATLPIDRPGGGNRVESERSVLVSLGADETRALLEQVPAVYRTQINDVLLTALVRGFGRWSGQRSLLIELEGHGREPLFDDVDLSRTIGWFTTHYPVWLESGGEGPREDLKKVKERLRSVPHRGLGYGVLRYLSPHAVALRSLPEPQVKFNYLGQLDQVLAPASAFAPAPESRGADRDPRSVRPRVLAIDGSVVGGQLHLRFSYSDTLHREESIRELAVDVMEELRRLVAHCLSPEAGGFTPSDFPLAGLRQEQLDQLLDALPGLPGLPAAAKHHIIEDVYPVSPLQKSLLLHVLSIPGTTVGFEQKSSLMQGGLDPAAFARTWQQVVDRHPILRTAFAWDGVEEPLQVVYRQVEVPLAEHDWRDLSPAEQSERLRAYLEEDRRRGFDPSRAPLMRLTLIRLTEDSYQFVWSYSHLLLDAWCRTLVLREVFAFYEAFSQGRGLQLPAGRPYRDYIAWLGRQDPGTAAEYWRRTLGSFTEPTPLWVDRLGDSILREERLYRCHDFQLAGAASAAVQEFARQQRLTVNSVLLGAWAVLLGRYSGDRGVLFGATVAGRPPDLPEVESMLGMFINNLPVRVELEEETGVGLWLQGLQDRLLEMRSFEWCSADQIREWIGFPGGQRLHDSLVLVQNYPVDEIGPTEPARGSMPGSGSSRLAVVSYESRLETNYPVTVVAGPLEPLYVRLFHDTRRIDPASAARMSRHLETLLSEAAGDPQRRLASLPLLTAAERQQLLVDWSLGRPAGEAEDLLLRLREGSSGKPADAAVAILARPAELAALLDAGWPETLQVAGCLGPLARGLAGELAAKAAAYSLYAPPGQDRPIAWERLDGSSPPSLGRPLPGVRLLLLGSDGQPVPQGIPGEVCFGWTCRSEPADLQRSGALARWLPDGRLEGLGTVDQVERLPAGRVHTGVVEAALRRHPALRDVAVASRRNPAGDARLVAYVVPVPAAVPAAEELRAFLQPQLPRQMVPSLFVFLEVLPLGPSGDVDRAALPAPESAGRRLRQAFEAPRDPLEAMLVQIWEDLLGVQPIGIRDNFFELGGHSLLAARLLAALPGHFSRRLSLSALLQAVTVERLAEVLRRQGEAQAWSPLVEMQSGAPGLPFFCVHPLSGEVFSYRELAAAMGSSQPFYGLQAQIWEEHLEPHASIEDMAACYVGAMREAQPAGPYAVGGWSFGGLVALEMAQQLHAAGCEVGLLAILDTNLCPSVPDSARLERFRRFEADHASLSFEELWELASRDEEMGPELDAAKRLLHVPEGLDLRMIRRYRRVGEVFGGVRTRYRLRPYPGRITLFRAREGYVQYVDDPTLGWGEIAAGGLEICDVPGNHNNLVYRPYADDLAAAIRARLPQVRTGQR